MTAKEFTAWRAALALSQQDAADTLGVHLSTVQRYEKNTAIPVTVEMSCKWLRLKDMFKEEAA